MDSFWLNLLMFGAAVVVLFTIWGGVHLLARRRLGDRRIGCRGPQSDDAGNEVCCTTGRACSHDSAGRRERQGRVQEH